MAVVDAAVERYPAVDPERLGILGGSYGGYMTSWAIGHSDRFAAGCSERACNNLLTLETSSDAAGFFRFVFGIDHLDHPDEYLRCSPITYVKDIRTPVLILHSEEDLRCPVEQADQLFVALRMLGREQEYHRFPAESHELSRSGAPRHRVQRAEIILDWFNRKLRDAADDPAAVPSSS
jgi:dipeptidyl aminopeptidase/acylaminoacyl peptidase